LRRCTQPNEPALHPMQCNEVQCIACLIFRTPVADATGGRQNRAA
jgi:hypothetical protein